MSYADKPRFREVVTVTKVGENSITYNSGRSFNPPTEHFHRFHVGLRVMVETVNFSMVTGMALVDANDQPAEWLWLKTSEELDREHEEMVAGFKRDRLARLEANREAWARREAALPHPLRRRLERFRQNGGDDFDSEGWGYELVVCELAVLYHETGGEDSERVMAFARAQGTSGNQHDYAKALAPLLADEDRADDIANSVSALAPLTGDADYSGAKR